MTKKHDPQKARYKAREGLYTGRINGQAFFAGRRWVGSVNLFKGMQIGEVFDDKTGELLGLGRILQ